MLDCHSDAKIQMFEASKRMRSFARGKGRGLVSGWRLFLPSPHKHWIASPIGPEGSTDITPGRNTHKWSRRDGATGIVGRMMEI
jgi:hypothetical protein